MSHFYPSSFKKDAYNVTMRFLFAHPEKYSISSPDCELERTPENEHTYCQKYVFVIVIYLIIRRAIKVHRLCV